MAGRHIRYNVAASYFEYSTTGLEAGPWDKLNISGHTEVQGFRVGGIYTNITGVNPATELGYGTWVALAAGRVLVGWASGDPDFGTVRNTGGFKTHTLITSEIPSHTHTQDAHNHTQDSHNHTQDGHGHAFHTYSSGGSASISVQNSARDATQASVALGGVQTTTATNQAATATNQAATATNQNTGGGGAHNNLQPFYTVHFWERTA